MNKKNIIFLLLLCCTSHILISSEKKASPEDISNAAEYIQQGQLVPFRKLVHEKGIKLTDVTFFPGTKIQKTIEQMIVITRGEGTEPYLSIFKEGSLPNKFTYNSRQAIADANKPIPYSSNQSHTSYMYSKKEGDAQKNLVNAIASSSIESSESKSAVS